MTEREYTVIKTLENKIAFKENNNQTIMFITVDLMKEVLDLLKAKENEINKLRGIIKTADDALESVKEKINDLLYEDLRRARE